MKHSGMGWIVLALALAASPPARAISTVKTFEPSDWVVLDSSNPDTASGTGGATATVSLSAGGTERRVLARLPAALFEMDTNRLERAELSMTFEASRWVSSRPLVLHAMTNSFDPASVSWNYRAAGEEWRREGGDPVDRYCVTATVQSVTSGIWRATWNIRPMLWRSNTYHCLAANGLMIRMGGSKPSSGSVSAPFATAEGAAEAERRPEVYAVWQDEFIVTHDYAISGISNGPFHKEYATNATDETVFWEQDITTVGRCMLNATNGFESRAILCMPKELRTLDPDRIQKVEGHFEAYINTWSGERISMHPVTSPTRLEMAGNRPENGANPDHGPSWRWADGPVDTNDLAYPRLAWNNPGGDFDETIGAEARLVKLSQYVDSALFDLTPMWRNPAARALLLANGAIVRIDRSTWSNDFCAVQIYCSDGYTQFYKGADSSFRITLYPSLGGSAATNAPEAFFYLDAASPAWQSYGVSRIWVLINQDRAKGDTHGLLRLPEDFAARDPATLESAELHFRSEYNDTAYAPIFLHPLLEPFGWRNLRESANWTNAFNGSGTAIPWSIPGGAFSATCSTGAYAPESLDLSFDLMPLLADPAEAARAATNGLLLRIDPAWTNFVQKTFARYNIERDTAHLVLRDRPLAFALLRSDAPDASERPAATLPFALAADGAETHLAVRFGDAVFSQDPARIGNVRLFLTSAAPLPAGCELRLSPLATPIRLGEATWNRASAAAPWNAPGGDVLDRSVAAVPSAGGTGCFLDLAPLLRDPEACAALRANGGLLRLVRTAPAEPPAPAAKAATTDLAWSADGPAATDNPVLLAIPAYPEISSLVLDGDSVAIQTIGLDPALDYTIQTAPAVTNAAVWSNAAPLPRSGSTTLPRPPAPTAFYRLHAAP